jgi:hypothetical protein
MSARLTANAASNLSYQRRAALDTFIVAARENSSNANLLVTSAGRSSQDQARAMLNNYTANPAAQRRMYRGAGQQVLNYFDANARQTTAQKIAGAAQLIDKLALEGNFVSHHISAYQNNNNLFVFDIGYSSINDKQKLTTYLESIGASKLLDEPVNNCLHVEISATALTQANRNYLSTLTTNQPAKKPSVRIR